ncbi:MAG: FG-GAP repeat domain-containing protein [Isosphaeraceae bacterium]
MHKPTQTLRGVFCLISSVLLGAHASAQAPKADARPKLADYFGFQALEIYKLEHRIGNLMLKDLDGDKTDDIVVSDNARSRIDLLLSTKKADDDQSNRPFRKDPNDLPYDHRMRLAHIPVNKEVVSLDSGDFNGDGKPDLVFYGTPAEVVILFNEGSGRFGNPKRISTGDAAERPSALTVGDLDQDGRDDLVLLAQDELIFVYQTAAGTLGEPERVPHTAANPWLVKAVDIDGNGAKDLVILDTGTDQPIHIRFATEEKKLGPEQRFAVEVPRAIAFGQVDGQPGMEILTIEGQSGRARVLKLDQSGTDESNKRGRLTFFGLPKGSERGRSLGLGDLDGDGKEDVVVTDPAGAQVWVYLQLGRLGLSAGQTFPSFVGARAVHLADLDGDRKAEVYVLSDQEKQIGQSEFIRGRLSFPTPLPITGEPVAMDITDLDGNKTLEILYIARTKPGSDSFELRALTRDKAGSFGPYKWGNVEAVALGGVKSVPSAIESLDINQDGQADLMIFNQYLPAQLLLGKKGGAPQPFTGGLGPLTGATSASVSLMNLDGPALLVAQNTFARRVALDPKGHWNIKDQFNSGRNNAQILGAAAVDTDGDGSKEIVLFDRTSKSLLFLAQKDGVYRPSGTLLVGAINFQGMSVADFDGDGRDDLLIAGSDRFAVLQTGLKGLRLKMIAGFEPRRNEARLADLAVGDVNGDGCPDVVFSDIGEQSLEIATYAGDKDLIPAITFRIFERKIFHNAGDTIEPRDMGIGDVDGDGRSDIVLIAHDRVLVYRQDPGPSSAKPGAKPPVASRSEP